MEKKKKFIIDVMFVGVILLLVWAASKYILPVLIPFIVAFVIASLLQILVRKICKGREKYKRQVSLLVTIAFLALAAWGIGAVGAKAISSIAGFVKAAPDLYQQEVVPALGALSDTLEKTVASLDAGIAAEIDNVFQTFVNNIGNYITSFSVNAVKFVSGSIVGIPAFVIRLIVTIISIFFWMGDYDKIIGFCVKCIPGDKVGVVKQLLLYVKMTIFIYLKSYSILFVLTFVELSIGFSIMKIPYPIWIALATAVFDIMPILGVGGILLPWAVILVLLGDFPLALGMLVLYLVITIIRNTVEPKVVGKQIGLHPLATLISMYLGLQLIGILGMFIFPVTLTILVGIKREGGNPNSPFQWPVKKAE